MTTLELKLTLADTLAREAQAAGLLTPQAIETMLRETLRQRRVEQLFEAMDRMAAIPGEPMTAEEIQAEIELAREEFRQRSAPRP